ncbi:MAG: hypothetical protein ACJ71W_10415 [Terriglobales bacterium]
MSSRTRLSIAREFAYSLDSDIQRALKRAFDRVAQQKVPNEQISLELFFCALCVVAGKRFFRQFENSQALQRLQEELVPADDLNLIQRYFKKPRNSSRDTSWTFVSYDERLGRILWDAIRIAKAAGRHSAGMREVLTAFCLADEIVLDLKKKHGFVPKLFLERLPSASSA